MVDIDQFELQILNYPISNSNNSVQWKQVNFFETQQLPGQSTEFHDHIRRLSLHSQTSWKFINKNDFVYYFVFADLSIGRNSFEIKLQNSNEKEAASSNQRVLWQSS